jgi:hypothetical protein
MFDPNVLRIDPFSYSSTLPLLILTVVMVGVLLCGGRQAFHARLSFS